MAIQATGFKLASIQVRLGLTYGNPGNCFITYRWYQAEGTDNNAACVSPLSISKYESKLYSPRKSYLYLLDQTRCLILGVCPRAFFCLSSKQYHTLLHSTLAYPPQYIYQLRRVSVSNVNELISAALISFNLTCQFL